MFELHDFYKELSQKYNLSFDQIEKIARIEFKWLMSNMQSGDYKSIKLISIGKFNPLINRIEKAKQYKDANNTKRDNGHRGKREGQEEDQISLNQENV